MSSFFGLGQQYPHFYHNTDDDEVIQPARHSFWEWKSMFLVVMLVLYCISELFDCNNFSKFFYQFFPIFFSIKQVYDKKAWFSNPIQPIPIDFPIRDQDRMVPIPILIPIFPSMIKTRTIQRRKVWDVNFNLYIYLMFLRFQHT